jgi:hypothetical protein
MGVSTDRLGAALAGIRTNLGGSSSSITDYLGDMKSTLSAINQNVSDDMKISSDELVDIYKEMGDDVKNAGMNMKTFAQYTRDSQVWARQLGGPLAKAVELGKKLADLKSGKTAGGEESFAMTAATGVFKRLRSGAKSQFDRDTTEKAKSQGSLDFQKTLVEKIQGLKTSDKTKEALTGLASDPETLAVMQAVLSNDPETALMALKDNQKVVSILRKLEDAGFGEVADVPLKEISQAYAKTVLDMTGRGRSGEARFKALGGDADRFKDLQDAEKGRPSTPMLSNGQEQISSENATLNKLQTSVSPVDAAKAVAEGKTGTVVKTGVAATALAAKQLHSGYQAAQAAEGGTWLSKLLTGSKTALGMGGEGAAAAESATWLGRLGSFGKAFGRFGKLAGEIVPVVTLTTSAIDAGSQSTEDLTNFHDFSKSHLGRNWEEARNDWRSGNYLSSTLDWTLGTGSALVTDGLKGLAGGVVNGVNWMTGFDDSNLDDVDPAGNINLKITIPGRTTAKSLANQARNAGQGTPK